MIDLVLPEPGIFNCSLCEPSTVALAIGLDVLHPDTAAWLLAMFSPRIFGFQKSWWKLSASIRFGSVSFRPFLSAPPSGKASTSDSSSRGDIWNESLGTRVAVSELACARGKPRKSKVAQVVALAVAVLAMHAQYAANANSSAIGVGAVAIGSPGGPISTANGTFALVSTGDAPVSADDAGRLGGSHRAGGGIAGPVGAGQVGFMNRIARSAGAMPPRTVSASAGDQSVDFHK